MKKRIVQHFISHKMKYLFYGILCILIVGSIITLSKINAANDPQLQANITKYRAYRSRLKKKFVRISPNNEPGSNLVASKRNAFWKNSGIIDFGDTTALMGYYLGMLATEYKLLSDEGKSTDTTLKELAYAIKALERLDLEAEIPYGKPSSLDGYFIRDDVQSTLVNKFNFGGMTQTNGSDYPNGYPNFEKSQDQCRSMLLGLSLVKKLVPAYMDINGEGFNFQQRAKDMTYRIVKQMQIKEKKTILWHDYYVKKRRIKNPRGNLVARGAMGGPDWIAIYSYLFARAGGRVADQDMTRKESVDLEREAGYELSHQLGLGRFDQIMNNQELKDILIEGGVDLNKYAYELYAARTLGTISNRRGDNTPNLVEDKYDFLSLVHYILHGNTSRKKVVKKSYFQDMLTAAPVRGPFNYGGTDRPYSDERTSQNRLRYPEDRGTIDPNNTTQIYNKVGEYNGLDYMLLHNLFLITYKDILPQFTFGKSIPTGINYAISGVVSAATEQQAEIHEAAATSSTVTEAAGNSVTPANTSSAAAAGGSSAITAAATASSTSPASTTTVATPAQQINTTATPATSSSSSPATVITSTPANSTSSSASVTTATPANTSSSSVVTTTTPASVSSSSVTTVSTGTPVTNTSTTTTNTAVATGTTVVTTGTTTGIIIVKPILITPILQPIKIVPIKTIQFKIK